MKEIGGHSTPATRVASKSEQLTNQHSHHSISKWIKIPSLIGGRIFPRKSPFQALRLGPFLIFAFPGEAGSETGADIEREIANLMEKYRREAENDEG